MWYGSKRFLLASSGFDIDDAASMQLQVLTHGQLTQKVWWQTIPLHSETQLIMVFPCSTLKRHARRVVHHGTCACRVSSTLTASCHCPVFEYICEDQPRRLNERVCILSTKGCH